MSDRRHTFGYDHRGRYPSLQLRHNLVVNHPVDIRTADSWLRNQLGIDASFLAATSRPLPRNREQVARAICERTLILYGELLRLCRVPIYDTGRVLRIAPNAGDWANATVDVILPVVDHLLPEAFYRGMYSDALSLFHTYLLKEPGEEAVAKLYAVIQSKLVDGFAKSSPFTPVCLELCQLAHKANIPFRHHGGGVIRFGWGSRSRSYHHSALQADSAVGGAIAYDKQLTARYLKSAGFPVPEHTLVTTPAAASAAAAKYDWHVVVKPADRERSQGITLDVTCEEKLLVAFERARAASERVLVERHVPGVCHRILIAGGQVVYAVKRNPKGVIGDGALSVAELIARAQACDAGLPPWKRLAEAPFDDLAIECLGRAGLTRETVPAPGQYVPLRPSLSAAWGGTVVDVHAHMHPRNARLAIDIANTLGLSFAGVDFITTDIARPWDEVGVINEVNFKPEFATIARSLRTEGLMSALAVGDGRIPVHLLTGDGDLRGTAQALIGKIRAERQSCHLTSRSHSEDGGGRVLAMTHASLFERAIAMLMRSDVEQLLLIDEDQELLRTGFPVDRFDKVWVSHSDRKARDKLRRQIEMRAEVGQVRPLNFDARLEPQRIAQTIISRM